MGRIVANTNVKAALEASRNLPAGFDQIDGAFRGSPYGDLYTMPVLPEAQVAADEGTFWTVTNPTPGTGIATITTQTTLVDTAPYILFKNSWGVADGARKRIIAKWLRLTCTAPGTSSTALRFATKTDQAGSRYTSGATVIVGNKVTGATNQPANTNADITGTSGIQLYAGPVVAVAAANPTLIDAVTARLTIPVIGDSFLLVFGGNEAGGPGFSVPATIAQFAIPMAPWVVGPQEWGAFHLWQPAMTVAAAYEFTFGYVER